MNIQEHKDSGYIRYTISTEKLVKINPFIRFWADIKIIQGLLHTHLSHTVLIFRIHSNVLSICLNLFPLTATFGVTDEEINPPGYQLSAFPMPFAFKCILPF